MKQYQKLLKKILKKGVEKESGRANMPNTIGIEYGKITMDLRRGFPLLTTKKMFWKGIVHELLWFLRGDTNIKYLVDNGVNIWNGDAYRWYLQKCDENNILETKTMDVFISTIKKNSLKGLKAEFIPDYTYGDLGKVYGYQWRNQNGVDQIADIVDGLKNNPYSRYHILDGWNKADFRDMALPPCHLLYQFIVKPMTHDEIFERIKNENPGWEDYDPSMLFDTYTGPKFYLNVNMYQRSCDTFLGVPFNLASMSLLLMIIAKTVNMVPLKARWIGGDVHLYKDHIPVVEQQLKREPKYLPKMVIKKDLNSLEDIENLTIDDFELQDYESHGKLKAKLFTGNKL